MNDLSRFDLNGVWAPEHHVAPWYNRSRISSCSQRDKDEPGPVWRIFRRFKPQPTSYFQTSSEDIFLSVSLTPFSCPPCLEYLCPRALIRLRLWRYTNHVLTFTYACSTNRGANVQSASRQRATISGTSCRRRWPVRSASSAVSKYQPPSRAPIKLSTVGSRAFPVAAAQVWNGLPEAVVSSSSLQTFRRQLKTHLFSTFIPSPDFLTVWLASLQWSL